MSSCNILTISRIKVENEGSVEYTKIYNSLINNPKTELYLSVLEENDEEIGVVYDIFTSLSNDIVDICMKKVDDVVIEIDFDKPLTEITINIKLLLTRGEQMLDQTYFNTCIELSNKYEQMVTDAGLLSCCTIDFDIMLKNEYTKVITIKEEKK
jgi:hypothetical protein